MSAPAPVTTTIGPLDATGWEPVWNAAINPAEATAYGSLLTPAGLCLQMYSKIPYGAWLAKNIQPLPRQAASITFRYDLTIDQPTLYSAQVIETDSKITDSAGWTYCDGFQINIAKGWLIQVGAPWQDTPVKLPPPIPGVPMRLAICYTLDYAKHSALVVGVVVNGKDFPIGMTIPAKQEGWAHSEIVTQLQQCNRGVPGGYTITLANIHYDLA